MLIHLTPLIGRLLTVGNFWLLLFKITISGASFHITWGRQSKCCHIKMIEMTSQDFSPDLRLKASAVALIPDRRR